MIVKKKFSVGSNVLDFDFMSGICHEILFMMKTTISNRISLHVRCENTSKMIAHSIYDRNSVCFISRSILVRAEIGFHSHWI